MNLVLHLGGERRVVWVAGGFWAKAQLRAFERRAKAQLRAFERRAKAQLRAFLE
ncbi:hypothetical protein [[Phormidium] sp. ETS-05]|uniref:hypothetical protein n=1 Tax=[Phormidium] sp. ETS-05 TaxID=222819 RepID=UPI0018EEDDD3|nr:hypothetical protein [[Phormidium] sp. ETS-05]